VPCLWLLLERYIFSRSSYDTSMGVFFPDLAILQTRVGFNKSQSSKCRWTGFDYRSRPDLLLTFIVEKLLFFNVISLYIFLSRPDQKT
jgi:hypothetical protein